MDIKSILLNHKLFVVSVVLFAIITVGILILATATSPKVEDIVLDPVVKTNITFPMDLYLTNTITPAQSDIIVKALDDWNKQTNGVCKVNVIKNWKPSVDFNVWFYRENQYKTVWYLPISNTEVAQLVANNKFFDGIAPGDFILISSDGMASESDNLFYIIFKHEFGHMLGLRHLKEGYSGLMGQGDANNGSISKYDLIQFCHLYSCK